MRQTSFNMSYREIKVSVKTFLYKLIRIICHIKGCDMRDSFKGEMNETWCNMCGNRHVYSDLEELNKSLFIIKKLEEE